MFTYLFSQVEDLTNQLANFFLAEGYSHGDVIALVLDNSIEYPCVWIGLSKIGCIAALINSNLRATSLLHSIRTVNAKGIITSKQLLPGKYFLNTFGFSSNEFLLEIEFELKELNINKVYLFDSKHISTTTQISNGCSSVSSSLETIQLYERLERCSTQPTKPIPYDLKRILFRKIDELVMIYIFV